RSIACVSNLKQLSTAIIMYTNDNEGYLPRASFLLSDGTSYGGWTQQANREGSILNYIGAQGARNSSDKADHIFKCGSAPGSQNGEHYCLNDEADGKQLDSLCKGEALTDKILVTESKGVDLFNCYGICYNAGTYGIRISHGTRANAAFMDGHVDSIESKDVTFTADDYYYIHTINHTKNHLHAY
ncbi:MAG: hypothetical protein J6S21_01420, partial [Victivallales bacterium]|nr:hypothetical protein [Victivallales bacterium]